jgi:hypothetical protein
MGVLRGTGFVGVNLLVTVMAGCAGTIETRSGLIRAA